jgi:hypothetical protein
MMLHALLTSARCSTRCCLAFFSSCWLATLRRCCLRLRNPVTKSLQSHSSTYVQVSLAAHAEVFTHQK